MADFKASTLKSLRNFEGGGVVGLGIVAAMNDLNHTHDSFFSAKSSRAAILAVSSPRSNPIPIVSNSVKPAAKFSRPILGKGEMEMSESYTCVISHFGNNLVKKREYFDDDDKPLGSHAVTTTTTTTTTNGNWVSSGVFCTSPPLEGRSVADSVAVMTEFQTADFLNSCYLCKKKLHGLDIFMYRGEKAFCSAECRYKQISSDEHKEKCGSGAMKSFEYSASPCSGPMLFFAGVAAA